MDIFAILENRSITSLPDESLTAIVIITFFLLYKQHEFYIHDFVCVHIRNSFPLQVSSKQIAQSGTQTLDITINLS